MVPVATSVAAEAVKRFRTVKWHAWGPVEARTPSPVRGSRLHGNGESWDRLRTVSVPLDGRRLRHFVAGFSGQGMEMGRNWNLLSTATSMGQIYSNLTNHSLLEFGVGKFDTPKSIGSLSFPIKITTRYTRLLMPIHPYIRQADASRVRRCMPFQLSLGSMFFGALCHSVEPSGF